MRDCCPEKSERSSSYAERSGSEFRGGFMTTRGQRKANGHFDLAESPAHLMRRCHQFYGDLYSRESGTQDLTKQQYLVLLALEHQDGKGISQTALVETTGIDRSTLAEMVRRMLERGLVSRERVKDDQRANAVAITQTGRKALRGARLAASRAEKAFLEVLPAGDRGRFVKALALIAAAADSFATNGASYPIRRQRPRRRHVD
jgi:DNA-binding MarR family transcriptional regulator